MVKRKADITEIFSSIQGEGIFLGVKQIFVRFKNCNMNCSFCDVSRGLLSAEYDESELIKKIRGLGKRDGPHHSISFTGGEPLLYADFLKGILTSLKKTRLGTYLETNGTLPDKLKDVIGLLDIIAMDFKLPSSTGEKECWDKHFNFLKIAARKKVFVKAIITPNTAEEDIERSADMIKGVDKNIPFILQPVMPASPIDNGVDKDSLMSFFEISLKKKLTDVRVIPQVHKILGMR